MRRTSETTRDSEAGALRVALAWLGHPVSLVGIAVLLLNDHVLKAEYGTWWTGKLSDVAGLVFAPALLAVVVAALRGHRGRPRVVAAASLATIGLLFTLVKATAVGATIASAVWTAIAGPSVVRQDVTDLLALPALALAWWAFTSAQRRPVPTRTDSGRTLARARALILVPIATLAVAATSAAPTYMASDVAVVDGTLYVGVEYVPDEDSGYPQHPPDWHSTDVSEADPSTWSWKHLWEPDDEDAERARQAGDSQKIVACVPGDSTICYRIVDGALGVERSDDGGDTWSPEWGFTSSERDRLIALTLEVYDPETQFVSRSLAVFEVGDGHEVVVANGLDGIAVRMTKGTWSRHQVPGNFPDEPRPLPDDLLPSEEGYEAQTPVQTPTPPVLPWPLVLGWELALVAFLVSILRLPRGQFGMIRRIGGGVLLGLGVVSLMTTFGQNLEGVTDEVTVGLIVTGLVMDTVFFVAGALLLRQTRTELAGPPLRNAVLVGGGTAGVLLLHSALVAARGDHHTLLPPLFIGGAAGAATSLFVLALAARIERMSLRNLIPLLFLLPLGIFELSAGVAVGSFPDEEASRDGLTFLMVSAWLVMGAAFVAVSTSALAPFGGRWPRMWRAALVVALATGLAWYGVGVTPVLTVLAGLVWIASTAWAVRWVRRPSLSTAP